MSDDASVFEKHYQDYLKRISDTDLASRAPILGTEMKDGQMIIPPLLPLDVKIN